jgi:hypothetical protein
LAGKLSSVPGLAAIAVIVLVALAVWWKARCIWRGCTVDPEKNGKSARKRSVPPRHL